MSESGCFCGLGIAGIGKLQHSYHYYSQVVPRHGGHWENAAHVADYVVVPFNIAEVCKSNAALRRAVSEVLCARRPRFVDESFLADSIAGRRFLTTSEVQKRTVHIPLSAVRQWTEEIGRPIHARPHAAIALPHSRMQTRDTQTDAPPKSAEDITTEQDDEMQLELLENNLHAMEVRQAERVQAGGAEAVTYYVSQQGCFNSEMREKIFAYLQEGDTQLEWFHSQTASTKQSLTCCLNTGRAALAEYHRSYATAKPDLVTKFSLAAEWNLLNMPQKGPLRTYPLHNYLHLLQLLRTSAMSQPKLDGILAGLIPVWDTYMHTTTSTTEPSVLSDLISGNLLAHTDSLAELKASCIEPLDTRVAAMQKSLRSLDDEKAAAQVAKDYATAIRLGLECVSLVEEVLNATHRFQKNLTAGTVDVEMAGNALTAFKRRKDDMNEIQQKKVKLKADITADKRTINDKQGELQVTLQELLMKKRDEADDFEQQMDANAKQMTALFTTMEGLQEELKELSAKRLLLCQESAKRTEELSAEVSWCEQRLSVVPELEAWVEESMKHCNTSFEVLKLTRDTYEDLEDIVDAKGACNDALDEMILHGAQTHVNLLGRYCALAGGVMNGLATKRTAIDVHNRAVDFQLQLADASLDHTTKDLEKLAHDLRAEHARIDLQYDGLAKRVGGQMSIFDGYSAQLLDKHSTSYTHPGLQLRKLASASELSTRAALTSHVEREKQVISEALSAHLTNAARPISPTAE